MDACAGDDERPGSRPNAGAYGIYTTRYDYQRPIPSAHLQLPRPAKIPHGRHYSIRHRQLQLQDNVPQPKRIEFGHGKIATGPKQVHRRGNHQPDYTEQSKYRIAQ